MGQRKGSNNRFAPVRGLVTEANEGNFPPDAAFDIDNMEVLKNGITRRRLGIDRENVESDWILGFTESDRKSGLFATFLWKAVSDGDTQDLRVVQVGTKIKIYPDILPLSTAPEYMSIDLRDAPYTTGQGITSVCQFAYGAGYILVTNPNIEPLAIEVDSLVSGSEVLTPRVLRLKVRTTSLIEGGISVGGFPILAGDAEFNLRNSGWPFRTKATQNAEGGDPGFGAITKTDPVFYFGSINLRYPTPPELFTAHKATSVQEADALGVFSPWEADKINFGNTTPPLGHFIHSAYAFDSLVLMSQEGLPISTTTVAYTNVNRPTCCAFLNGHAVYGDIDEQNNARILVSQVVKSVNELERCYQEADPTAEEINDVIATDGFVLRPTGMGQPLVMRETAQGLAILCTNGVWALRSTGGAFGATDFKLDKVVELEFNSPQSVAVVDDVVYFCAAKAIFAIAANQFGELGVEAITDNSIKTLYQELGVDRIAKAHAAYVSTENYIYWLIPKAPTNGQYGAEGHYMLVLNLELGGFFQYSTSDDNDRPALHMPMVLTNTTTRIVDEQVTTLGSTINVTSGPALVTSGRNVVEREGEVLAFLASHRRDAVATAIVAKMQFTNMFDWGSYDGGFRHSYSSFIEFAYNYPESMIGGVQAPYIHSFFETGRVFDVPDFPEPPPVDEFEYFRVQQSFVSVLEDLS